MKATLTRTLIALIVLSALVLTIDGGAALAQQATPEQTAASQGSDPEANLPYLFAAYSITWIGFFVYAYYLSQRNRSLRREVEALREALGEREQRGGGG